MVIFTSFALAASAGARRILTPVGPATSSTRARPALDDILEDVGTRTLKYLYDFGDGWEHTIKIERLIDPEPGVLYPRLIEISGRCPPEDCGGPWGYAELLEVIKDPKHERYAELTEWIGDDFDPDAVDPEWLTAEVAALAKKWSRKPATKRARRA